MKTDFGVISGQREEASKDKVMHSIQSLNRQGSLDSNKEDGGATLILTLTLCNVRKTEFSRAAKVFEVQTLPLTFHSLSPLTHLFCPYCLHLSFSPSLTALLLLACAPKLCLLLLSPFLLVPIVLQSLRELDWPL